MKINVKKILGKKVFLNVIFFDFFLGKNNFVENYVGCRSINKNKQNILLFIYFLYENFYFFKNVFLLKSFTFHLN